MTNNIADISVFESLQTDQHSRTGISPMSVFNEFTRKSDASMIKSLEELLEHLRKNGKKDSQDQDDFERELNWTEGVYKAAQKRLEADDYETKT